MAADGPAAHRPDCRSQPVRRAGAGRRGSPLPAPARRAGLAVRAGAAAGPRDRRAAGPRRRGPAAAGRLAARPGPAGQHRDGQSRLPGPAA